MKELKGIVFGALQDERSSKWNPVKELKDIICPFPQHGLQIRWNPVKELKADKGDYE